MAEDCKYQVKRANLHYVREQISKFLCDLDTRVVTLEQSISGGTRFSYKWNDTLTGDPTSGYVATDTNDPNTVTEIRISDLTVEGTDASEFISELQADDLVALYEGVEPNSAAVFTVLGIPVDNGTYFTIPVTLFPATGTALPALKDNPVDVHLLERRQHKLYDEHIHTDVDSSTPLEQRHILGWNALDKWAADFRMNWRGLWLNQEYQKHDVVLDSPYTMIANKVTTDRAAPVPIGDPAWDIPDDNPPWLNLSQVAVVGSGHTYTFNETVQANSLRVWIPTVTEDYTYRLTTIRDGNITQDELTTLSAGQWNVLGINPILLGAGSQFQVYLEALNSGGTTTVTGGWIRGINDNALEPANQHWNMNVQRTVLRIDFDDLDAINRQGELEGIIVGSTIQIAETASPAQNSITYQVVNPPVTGTTSVIYDVIVIAEGVNLPTVGEPCTITADVPVPQATDYVGITDGWLGNQPVWGTVVSYLAFDGVEQVVSPDNQYGISLNVQRINVSDDWDLVAFSGNAGSGGGVNPAELQGYLGEAFPTGLYDGGELNIVNAGLNVEIIAGAGVVVNSYDKPTEVPTKVNLSWDTQDQAITTPAVAGAIAWITMADSGTQGVLPNTNLGVLTERSTQPTPAQERDEIFIGFLIYNGTSWGEVSTPTVVNSTAHSFNEYVKSVDSLTHIDSGGELSEAALFKLDQAAGVIWELNRNWHVNRKDPNREPFDARPAFQWRYVNRDISYVSALTDTVDPTNWDDGTPSTVVPVGGAAVTTTIQRLFLDPRDNYWVLYGQVKHDNFFEALANLGWDETQTEVPFLLSGSLFLGYIVSERSETDWVEEKAEFITAVRALTGGASAPVTTYDDLTDTPSNKLGAAGKFPKVNVAETAHEYEFIEWSDIQNPPAGADLWTGTLGGDIWNSNSGNVGIGTTSPAQKLTIAQGNVLLDNTFAIQMKDSLGSAKSVLRVQSDDWTTLRSAGAGVELEDSAGSYVYRYQESADVHQWRNNTVGGEVMRLSAAGSLGIGTSTPGYALDVVGQARIQTTAPALFLQDTDNLQGYGTIRYLNSAGTEMGNVGFLSSTTDVLHFRNDTTGGSLGFDTETTRRMTIASDGNVGIGTTTPTHKLEVVATSNSRRFIVEEGSSANNIKIASKQSSGVLGYLEIHGYEQFFYTNIGFVCVISDAGNFGIGTSTPDSFGGKLVVRDSYLNVINNSDDWIVRHSRSDGSWALGIKSVGHSSPAMAFHTNDTERMRIRNSGDVYIGAQSQTNHFSRFLVRGAKVPDNIGEVYSAAFKNQSGETTDPDLGNRLYTLIGTSRDVNGITGWNNTTQFIRWQVDSSSPTIASINIVRDTATSSNHNMTFDVGNTERVRIDNLGDVIIGKLGADKDTQVAARVEIIKGTTEGVHTQLYVAPLQENGVLGQQSQIRFGAAFNENWAGTDYAIRKSGAIEYGSANRTTGAGSTSARAMAMKFYVCQPNSWGDTPTEVMRIDAYTGTVLIQQQVPSGSYQTYGLEVGGSVNIASGENYYINGIPISTFIDAPADGNLYARKDNAWASIGTGAGTVSDLSLSRNTTQNTILNTGGDDVTLQPATDLLAGVMTAADKDKLDSVAPNANDYVHPSYAGDDIDVNTGTLTGAQVISRVDINVTTDTEGHVVDANGAESVRTLTPADIGAVDEADFVPITGSVYTPTMGGVTNTGGSVIVNTIGAGVTLYGRVSWSTGGSGTTQAYITLPSQYPAHPTLGKTGFAVSCTNVNNRNTDGNGFRGKIDNSGTRINLWAMAGNGISEVVRYQDLDTGGEIDIQVTYYTDAIALADDILLNDLTEPE